MYLVRDGYLVLGQGNQPREKIACFFTISILPAAPEEYLSNCHIGGRRVVAVKMV